MEIATFTVQLISLAVIMIFFLSIGELARQIYSMNASLATLTTVVRNSLEKRSISTPLLDQIETLNPLSSYEHEDTIFKTPDGKHEAKTFEELLRKIKNDPTMTPPPNHNKSDFDKLNDAFGFEGDDDFFDSDDGDDWKKGKQ